MLDFKIQIMYVLFRLITEVTDIIRDEMERGNLPRNGKYIAVLEMDT